MTKIEQAIRSIERKIEWVEKRYQTARAALLREMERGSDLIDTFNPVFIKQYADQMVDAQNERGILIDQLDTLRAIQAD